MRIWDLTTNEPRELYIDSDEIPFRSIAVTRNSKKLVAGNNAGTCFIWEEQGFEYVPMQILMAHPDQYVLKCQFSSDGKFLATCSSDRTCTVW